MRLKLFFLTVLILSLSYSCKKEGCTDESAVNYNQEADKDDGSCEYAQTYATTFTFTHKINGAAFDFDTIMYAHPAGYNYSVQTLKYFVSNLVLYKTNGDSVYIDIEHYIDARDQSTVRYIYDQSIENTTYSGMAFVFGLDNIKNVTGAFVNPPESLMEWPVPMGGGYHYMKFEGKYDSLGTTKNYNTHTGKLMGNPYFFRVDLPHAFSVVDNEINIDLAMELNNWYQNPSLYDFNVYGEAIMGNMAAQQAILDNGIDVFSITSIY